MMFVIAPSKSHIAVCRFVQLHTHITYRIIVHTTHYVMSKWQYVSVTIYTMLKKRRPLL